MEHGATKSYRVLVTGSSRLPEELVKLGEELGRELMTKTSVTLVTGGLDSRGEGLAAALDGVVARSALNALGSNQGEARSRIITVLPEHDVPEFTRVAIGQVVRVSHAGVRMRRNSMVLTSDAVVIINGDKGTREIADLAYVAGKPIVFFPFTGGAAAECWGKYRSELIANLHLTDTEIASLESPKTYSDAMQTCLALLMRALRPRCFVAMPYSGHPQEGVLGRIRAVAEEVGHEVVRIDQQTFSGDIIDAIWAGIRNSDVVIADLTNNNPNVLYELGISQAMNRTVILIVHDRLGEVPAYIPFDLQTQHILAYDTVDSLQMLLRRHMPPTAMSRMS